MRVVKDLVHPFVGLNHVIYCDNFYSSGPLVDLLAKDSIFLTGTIKKWVVTSFKSSVITCPFMANVTQSEP